MARKVWPKVSKGVARRLRIYAAGENIDQRRAARKVVERWVAVRSVVPACVGDEEICVTFSDAQHEILRIEAAKQDLTLATLVARILTALVPFETEVAVDSMTKED